jgi:formamidopyrimidine-DNA glycosylase
MPELPEVETVRLTLAPAIGKRVTEVWTSGLPLRLNQPVDQAGLRRAARGNVLEGVRRIGKYLLLDFPTLSVVVHLGMSGRLRLFDRDAPTPPHTHVVFRMGPRELRFTDPRRFGLVSVAVRGAERDHPSLAVLGPDPLIDPIDGTLMYELCRTKRPVKLLLLDQSAIAGIGNIYASEALWEARIRPTLPSARVSRPRAGELARAVRAVLDRALEHGGTSLRDFVDADGREGQHSHYLWVYGREGERCRRKGCAGTIRRTVLGGRATFHCPGCQSR